MGITIGTQYNQVGHNVATNNAVRVATMKLTFGNPYASGTGEDFDPTADLTNNFTTIDALILSTEAGASASGYLAQWDGTDKIYVYKQGTLDAPFNEVGAVDLSTLVVDCMIVGT